MNHFLWYLSDILLKASFFSEIKYWLILAEDNENCKMLCSVKGVVKRPWVISCRLGNLLSLIAM